MSNSALIIFQKNAELGKVKTRLAASLGDQKALEIYEWLTAYTHEQLEGLKVDKFIFYSDFIPETVKPEGYQFEIQSGETLGDRMSEAFSRLFELGYKNIIIVGTDCPYLKMKELDKAFSILSQTELVIGPARDGGYYLLGMNRFFPELFQDIPWSTQDVLKLTLDQADELHLDYGFLKVLSDIDTLEDWEIFNNQKNSTSE